MRSSARPPETDPETGLPIGPLVDEAPAPFPTGRVLHGYHTRLEPLGPEHDVDLFEAANGPDAVSSFRYLADRPPRSLEDQRAWREASDHGGTRIGYAVVDSDTGRTTGYLFLMRIRPEFRSLEIGNVHFGPTLRRTAAATEALYLVSRHVFEDLRNRRFEWKCDALNAPSRRAAERFGFVHEGIFRNDMILNGRSRDTAWYAMTDDEWPQVRAAFEGWLAKDNFGSDGRQIRPLVAFRG